MKKIYLLVLKAFVRPFIVTFFIVMFVLLMRFLFVYIDDLIGKGFEAIVILKLLWYTSAANVAMALPLAILLSSIMTFGSLSENYELVAIKSAGISLQRAMMPLVIVVSMLSVGAFLFSDYILPVANLKVGSLLYDVRNQKAAFLIDEGIFNNSISGYSIRARKKDVDGQTLYDVMIYEHNTITDNDNVLLAKEGKMFRSANKQYLVLKLKDGVRYEEAGGNGSNGMFNPRQRLTRFRFKETEQKFDLSEFKLQRTDENLFKSNDIMLNLKQLRYYRDSVQLMVDNNLKSVYNELKPYYKVSMEKTKNNTQLVIPRVKDVLEAFPKKDRIQSIQYAKDQIYSIRMELNTKKNLDKDYVSRLKGFIVEFHRKFTLSLSCIVLFFVGAPLGAIIRKGGLGLPVVVAVMCFLVYHIISTIGEKSVRDGSLAPVLGMWIALITLAPIGAFFTYKAATDSVVFDIDFYKRLFQKFILRRQD